MNNNTTTNSTVIDTNTTVSNNTYTNSTIIEHLTAEENLRNEELTGFLTGVGLLGLIIIVTLLLHRFANWRKTPWYALVTTWVNWMFAVSVILLIPVDVTSSLHRQCLTSTGSYEECDEPWVHFNREGLVGVWRFIYWTTTVMSWVIVPVMQSYVLAAHFHFHQRFARAIKENLIIYGVAGVIGGILAIYIAAKQHFGVTELVAIAMVLSNSYGLLLVICMLGYGLTELPKKLWRWGDKDLLRRYYNHHAYVLLQTYDKARQEVDTTLKLIRKYDERINENDYLRPYLDIIIQKCPLTYKDLARGDGDTDLTYDALVTLHGKLISGLHQLEVSRRVYEDLLKRAFNLEDVLKSEFNRSKTIEWTFKQRKQTVITPYYNKFEWYWKHYCQGTFWRGIAVLFSLMALCVIWSESLFVVDSVNLSIFSWLIVKQKNLTYAFQWFFTFVTIAFIALCAYWSLFQLRIFNFYRMVPHHTTDANSILFNSYYLSRVIAPMAYNFLLMVKIDGSAFESVMGPMTLSVPSLNVTLSYYFPILLALFCLGNMLDLYSKVVLTCARLFRCCIKQDIARFDFDDDYDDERVGKGKDIIAQEREFKKQGRGFSIDIGENLLTKKRVQATPGANAKAKFSSMFKWGKKQPPSNDLEMQTSRDHRPVPLEDN